MVQPVTPPSDKGHEEEPIELDALQARDLPDEAQPVEEEENEALARALDKKADESTVRSKIKSFFQGLLTIPAALFLIGTAILALGSVLAVGIAGISAAIVAGVISAIGGACLNMKKGAAEGAISGFCGGSMAGFVAVGAAVSIAPILACSITYGAGIGLFHVAGVPQEKLRAAVNKYLFPEKKNAEEAL